MSRPAHYGKWGQRGNLKIPEATKGLCRYCGDPVPPKNGRRNYCSNACHEAVWLRLSWPSMRRYIIERDKLCRLCGGMNYTGNQWEHASVYDEALRCSLPYVRIFPEWHVDHIKPCAEGGTDDPDNLRLLCGRCHKRITREWHGQRAAARRPQIALV